MTAATIALTDFLLARIAEDEAVARQPWLPVLTAVHQWAVEDEDWSEEEREDEKGTAKVLKQVLHQQGIFARVLDECAAKRQVVDMFSGNLHEKWDDGHEVAKVADALLRTIASVYADHPDYQQEWRP